MLQSIVDKINELSHGIMSFSAIFGHIVGRPIIKVSSGFAPAIEQLKKIHNSVLNRIFEKPNLTIAVDDLIRRLPKFQIFFGEGVSQN